MRSQQKKSKISKPSHAEQFSRRGIITTLSAGALAGVAFKDSIIDPEPAYAAELTLAGLESRIDKIAVYASVDRFPGMDPTGKTSSATALKAAMKAVPDGGTLIIPPGEYLVDSIISAGRLNISIYGYGAKLVQTVKGSSIISLSQTFTIIKASAVTAYNGTGNNSQNTTAADAAMFTTATATGWKKGDLVRIISDDVNADARPGAGGLASRTGEFAVVSSTEGTTVRLVGMLRDKYLTNVRVALMPKATIRIYGLEVATSDSGLNEVGGYGTLISLTGLYKPILKDIRSGQAGNQLIQFTACYGYLVDNLDAGYAVNKPDTNPAQLGYSIMDNCSSYGVIQNSIMRYVRHAYTDDTPRIAAADDTKFQYYGKTYGTRVINSHSLGTSGAAWDTHHCSENVSFHACSASHGGPGAPAFNLRGKGHSVTDGRAINMTIGVSVITESNGGESHGHTISNMYVKDASKTAVAVSIHPKGHTQAGVRDTRRNVTVDGLRVENTPTLFGIVNAKVKASNVDYTLSEGVDGVQYSVLKNQNSVFSLKNSDIDYTDNMKGTLEFCTALATTESVSPKTNVTSLKNVRFDMTPAVAARVARVISGPTHIVKMRDVELSHPLKYLVGDYAPGSSLQWRVDYEDAVAGSDANSGFHSYTNAAISSELKNVWASYERDITVQLSNTVKTTVTQLAPFQPGRLKGSILRFWVSGPEPVTVKHGSVVSATAVNYRTETKTKADKIMSAGSVTSFLWNGAVWMEIS